MTFKLSEISGIVPNKEIVKGYDHSCSLCCSGCMAEGRNDIVDHLNGIEIVVDEEEINKLLEELHYDWPYLVKLIAGKLPSLLKVKSVK